MAKTDKTNVEAAQWNKNFQQHNQELVLLEAMAHEQESTETTPRVLSMLKNQAGRDLP